MTLPEKAGAWLVGRWMKREGPKAIEEIKGGNMALIVRVLTYVATLGFLNGYRTYLAGFGAMLSGAALIVLGVAGDPSGDMEKGIAAVLAGLAIIGAAGKADKLTAVEKAAAVLQMAVAPDKPSIGEGVNRARIDEAIETVAPKGEKAPKA